MVYEKVGGKQLQPYMFDGNYVVASRHPQPWKKQLNILAAYFWFYNPVRFFGALVWPKSRLYLVDSTVQVLGMLGLAQTVRRTFGYALRLMTGRITRATQPPGSGIVCRHGEQSRTEASVPCPPK